MGARLREIGAGSVTRPAKPARVHYYVDADVLGLAKVLVSIRGDVTYPGDPGGMVKGRRLRPPCTIATPKTRDTVWIPETARNGWLAITRDSAIQDNRAEIEAVRTSSARMVAMSGREAISTFAQLEVLMCNWRRIEALLDEAGPYIYNVTRTGGLKPVSLD
jgi:hypothetical protein